jgi:hypothetical protein
MIENWIKCSERLPEGHTEVICIDDHGEYLIGSIVKIKEDVFCCESYTYKLFGITHWMPLPNKPAD